MSDEHHDAIRTGLRRATLTSLDTGDADHQRASLDGLTGESLRNVVRPMDFGFYSEPMAGASAMLMMLGGRSDRAHVLGFDDPRYRPQPLGAGSSAIYDATGNIVSLVQRKVRIVSPGDIYLQAPNIHIVGQVIWSP